MTHPGSAGALASSLSAASGWPLPGGGDTLGRWRALAALAEQDLVLARLAEAHADALAIRAELGAGPPPEASRWGVWAAGVPGHALTLDGGRLRGSKAWCSGATLLTHALVTVEGGLLCALTLDQPGIAVDPDTWAWAGMRGADTRTVRIDGAEATVVGEPGSYLSRPGFWVGGIGVAACWYGGATALAAPLRTRVAKSPEPHAAAHLGAVDVALGAARDALTAAAALVDADPTGDHRRLARRIRGTVAQSAAETATRVGRALGPGPYAADAAHAQRVADLEVYVRQDHAERDLAALGADVAAAPDPGWSL